MRKITRADRWRYWFDNTMSKGTVALIAWLGILTFVFIVGMGFLITLSGIANDPDTPGPDFFRIVWMSLLRTLDPGTMGGDTGSPAFLLAMLIVTLGGIFLVSTLIGILTSGIDGKLNELRKGRSFVVEQDHTLILGWSPQIFTIISEIAEANKNWKRACIVILADKDKVEMEDEIRARVPRTYDTRVVCRTGNPLDPTDLQIANPDAARSIIILAPQVDDPDTYVIKAILALTNNPQRKPEPYHIVAEIRDPRNLEVAQMVGRDEAQFVVSSDLISRITIQTSRQSGLSVVYTELLNFSGDEIYLKEEPALVGKTFAEALRAYDDAAVIGLHYADGGTQLNPPMDTLIAAGDHVIAIAEDDDAIKCSERTEWDIDLNAIQSPRVRLASPERFLILGWNHRAPAMINELNAYAAAGSYVLVVAHSPDAGDRIAEECDALQNLTVTFRQADTTSRRVLDELDVTTFDHIVVLGYSDEFGAQETDAQTLITLLHLRDLSERSGKELAIVSEMRDLRNRQLAEVTRADDFIVSEQLVSLILAQLSENDHLGAVFEDLFDPEGSEIYLKPAEDYVFPNVRVNFYTVIEAAQRRNEVAIGYRLRRDEHDASKAYGVVLNPHKSDRIEFAVGDKIIVLAES